MQWAPPPLRCLSAGFCDLQQNEGRSLLVDRDPVLFFHALCTALDVHGDACSGWPPFSVASFREARSNPLCRSARSTLELLQSTALFPSTKPRAFNRGGDREVVDVRRRSFPGPRVSPAAAGNAVTRRCERRWKSS